MASFSGIEAKAAGRPRHVYSSWAVDDGSWRLTLGFACVLVPSKRPKRPGTWDLVYLIHILTNAILEMALTTEILGS